MKKLTGRKRKHRIIRKKVIGTPEKPRLCVFRSNKNFYAQAIDDMKQKTLFSLSTGDSVMKGKFPSGGNVKAAQLLGEEFAKRAKEKGLNRLAFDRAGYMYHGRVKAFAEAARKNGLII